MAKLSIKQSTTSKSVGIVILDSTKTDGSGLTGLVYNSGSLIAYWYQPGVSAPAAISLATLASATTAYSSGGFFELDATHMKGHYRLDIPNACLTGATDVIIELSGATNMAPCRLEIELTATDNQDAVHGGMSALPNTACATNASLLTSGTGTDQLSVSSGRVDIGKALGTAVTLDANNVLNVSTKYWGGTVIVATSLPVGTAAGASGGLLISGSNAGTTTLGALTVTGATTLTGAVSLGSTLGVTGVATFTAGIAANITGNLIGTVSTLTTYTGNTPQTGDAYLRLGAPVGASISADIAEIEADTDTLTTGVIVTTNNDKTGYSLSSTGLDTITAWGAALTARQAIFMSAAGIFGQISGLPSSPATVLGLDASTTAAVVHFDSNNNRTSITMTLP